MAIIIAGESSMSRPTLSTEDVAKAQPIYVPKQNFMLAYRPHHFVDQHGRSYYLHQPATAIINGDSSYVGWHRYNDNHLGAFTLRLQSLRCRNLKCITSAARLYESLLYLKKY